MSSFPDDFYFTMPVTTAAMFLFTTVPGLVTSAGTTSSPPLEEVEQVRTWFPETWLWDGAITG